MFMEINKKEIQYTTYQSIDELDINMQALIEASRQASEQAYAPYSKFKVGAAVLLSNDKIITANNQENASYPEGLCAERVALFYASSQYPKEKIRALAIAGNSNPHTTDNLITPCGGCRQVLAEYESKQQEKIKIFMTGMKGKIMMVDGIDNLLPFRFEL